MLAYLLSNTRDPEAPILRLVDRQQIARIARSDLNPVDAPWFGQLMAGAQLLGYLWQVNRWMRERNVIVNL